MNWKILVYSLVIALPVCASEFKAGNELYDAGKFVDAAAAFAKIEPKTANVHFNLGNAWYRQDKLGRAVLEYERARQLAPRDPDVLANLRFAQQRLGVVEANVSSKPVTRFLQNALASRTPAEWGRYEVAALWLTVLSLAGWMWRPRWRTGFVIVAVAAALGWAVAAVALSARLSAAPAAVVLADKAEARFAPLPDSTVHFQAVEGTRVLVREDRGSWLFVERADGQQGWVLAEKVERVTAR
jgi:tetratricopeptide (TPR) repeat protein